MRKLALFICLVALLAGNGAVPTGQSPTPGELDTLLAPIALYPDSLLAQMLMCATDPSGVTALDKFLKGHSKLKGTELQDAALKDNFQPSFVALALFPQVVASMATHLDTTTRIGQAFDTDKTAVFASIQRLRKQAHAAGTLKTTPQQEVETQTTSGGEQVIVIEPANPQVIYVPQYNAQTVYVAPTTTTTTVVVEKDNSADAAVAGMVGFTAGIVIGAAVNNNYYYGPYGMHGGAYMYNDAWDDYYDHREDAREDWQDHREDISEDRGDRAGDRQDARGDRAGSTQRSGAAADRAQAGARTGTTASTASATSSSTKGRSSGDRQSVSQRSGGGSDAFSGYSSGRSERSASSRGSSSRSSSGRSRSGGGGRRR